jgi:TPR repeat protein
MELEARSIDSTRMSSATSAGSGSRPSVHNREPSLSTVLNTNVGTYGQQYQKPKPGMTDYSPASNYSQSNYSPFHESASSSPQFERKLRDMPADKPSFSHFPKVTGEHIPPSDEEKESVLADSRDHVLHSNDPNMQICWARDVLAYVEISAEAAAREYEICRKPGDSNSGRPSTPRTEYNLRLDATNIINYLADQGHPEAVFIRSKWLEFGKFGERQDKKEAYNGYLSAANNGWGRAEYRIGMLYENSNDIDKALRHYQSGLDMKDSAACYRLGMISLMGQHGQRKDIARGLDLIHQAADSADEDAPQGAFVYGMIIARDLPDVAVPDGVLSVDVGVARQYIEKAAYLGFAKAQLKMGQAYELCQLGCDFNPALSLHYYGLAARQGQPEACLGVSRWFLFGYEGTFAKNEQLAYKYAQLAAAAKLPTGEFALGYYNEIGIHVEKDIREARKWYELAAEHGNKDALGRLEGLSQSKVLSKQDHETTTLTRIKSQHGSQRGKRPERFKKVSAMPAVNEDRDSPRASPRVSPQPSPRQSEFGGSNMPEPNRLSGGRQQPAFTVNLAERPKSSAPYPDDDKPAPLNLATRPRSTAPYPDDDVPGAKPQLSPHYNPNIRPSADRPGSAFGIRTQSPGRQGPPGPAMRGPQSSGQLGVPPAGMDPNRGRPVSASAGWQPQAPSGYRQSSPSAVHPGHQDYARPVSAQYPGHGGPAPNNPAHNRLTKPNPNPALPPKGTPPPGQFPMGGYGPGSAPPPSQPGRDYGPRTSSRPVSSVHDPYGGRAPSAASSVTSPTMSGGMMPPPRVDSYGRSGLPTGGPAGSRPVSARPPVALQDRPMGYDSASSGPGTGRASAPPARPSVASPAPSTGTTSSAQTAPAAPQKTGPSTFEEMGIPQAKKDDECVSLAFTDFVYNGFSSAC